jgi:transposase
MARRTTKLGCPDVARIIDRKHKAEPPGWRKDRLLAIKLASKGENTGQEIADLCGMSLAQVTSLIKAVREGGLPAIWEKKSGGRPEGWRKGVTQQVTREFEAKLEGNEFVTLQDACRWLKEDHGIDASYNRVWYWAKKCNGVLLVPRPSHSKKDPAASEAFRKEFPEKLEALGLPAGTRAKVWVMDEARFGLHTLLRKVWSKKAKRPVVDAQIKYEWDYLYGSMEVTEGDTHFAQIAGVNLEWDQCYLENLAKQEPETVHILIRDQAGFHLRDGDPRLPSNIRIIDLPPYSPELNPCEQLWDLIKDELGNRVLKTIEALRDALHPILSRWWNDSERVLSLIGRPWLQAEANAMYRTSIT